VTVFTSAAPMPDRFLKVRDLLTGYILPSAASNTPLPPNPDAQKHLNDLLATVRPHPVKEPLSPMPKMSETVSGKRYVFDANLLGLQSLTLTFPPDSDEALMELVMEGEALSYAAYHKTNGFTYRAIGRLSEEDKGWLTAALDRVKAWFSGKPERPPDTIRKSDILGIWKGTDSLGSELTFSFDEDDSFTVIRNPSSLGRPSIGKYTISATTVSGVADTKVNFAVQKFGDEISGKWTYKVNGVSGKFTLKKRRWGLNKGIEN
jgi:hypothetical protein